VADVVRALIALMDNEKCYGQVYNIGSTNEISIGELAREVRQLCGSLSEIVHIPYAKAYEEGFEDMPRRVPDLQKLRTLTGYEPRVHLDEILDRVIEYFTSDKARV